MFIAITIVLQKKQINGKHTMAVSSEQFGNISQHIITRYAAILQRPIAENNRLQKSAMSDMPNYNTDTGNKAEGKDSGN